MTYMSQRGWKDLNFSRLFLVSNLKNFEFSGGKLIFALSQNPLKTRNFEILNSMAASWVTVGGGRFASCFLPLRDSVELVRHPRARKRVGRLVPSESTFDFGSAVRCSFGLLRGLVPRLWLTLARPGLVLGF